MGQNRDLKTGTSASVALASTAVSGNGTSAGTIIDMLGAGALLFIIHLLARTDGTYTPLIEHGDDASLTDAAAVPDDMLIGPADNSAAPEAAAARTSVGVSTIGYVGDKRYVRLSIVASAVTTGGTVAAVALKGDLSLSGADAVTTG